MPRYDVGLVKSAAEGRWRDILVRLGGVGDALLDGQHHGCPKSCHPDAGGKDRFRALDDFDQSGAVFCNQCFSVKNGDGLAALQWLTGNDFGKVLEEVAKYLGVKPEKGRKKTEPADNLEFLQWNRTIAHLWCQEKPPLKIEALERLGARYVKYLKRFTCIAIPVWGPQLDSQPAVGWILYRSDGGKLPRYRKKGEEPEWVKVLLTKGSEQGVVACLQDWKGDAENWWKLEGSTDLLAAMSAEGWLEGTAFFTTANGAQEKPLDWILKSLEGKNVRVCHDADRPGQQGATWIEHADGRKRAGWAPSLAKYASDVRNVQLPFAVEATHGPDIRDFFGGGGRVESLLELAESAQPWEAASASQATARPRKITDPQYLAEANLMHYQKGFGRKLRYYKGEWYAYKGTHYERMTAKYLQVRVRGFIQSHFEELHDNGVDEGDTVRSVTNPIVDNTVRNMEAMCIVKDKHGLNCWLNEDGSVDSGRKSCVAFKNGILDLGALFSSGKDYFYEHSPDWFSLNCLPYDCDLTAKCPAWIRFLREAFNDDPESIEAVQRWFGYLLLPDTSLDKMLYVIGPTRSGKGTMLRVMVELFGPQSVTSPTLSSLVSQYGMHSMYGKTIAVIPDARLSRRADTEAVTEKLLSLVADDPQSIERKYLDTINEVMGLRFTLFSNMLPELSDASAAMTGRGIYLLMVKSHLGNEDLSLVDRLKSELPGILTWSIQGRDRLENDPLGKRIVQPESSEHLIRQMRMSMAPVAQFLEERISEVPDCSEDLDSIYEAWRDWSRENGYAHKYSHSEFERKAVAAKPNYRIQVKYGSRQFVGVRLKDDH